MSRPEISPASIASSSQSSSSSTGNHPFSILAYDAARRELERVDLKIDSFVAWMVNEKGQVQLEILLDPHVLADARSDPFIESLGANLSALKKRAVVYVKLWASHLAKNPQLKKRSISEVRLEQASLLGGESFLSFLDIFQRAALADLEKAKALVQQQVAVEKHHNQFIDETSVMHNNHNFRSRYDLITTSHLTLWTEIVRILSFYTGCATGRVSPCWFLSRQVSDMFVDTMDVAFANRALSVVSSDKFTERRNKHQVCKTVHSTASNETAYDFAKRKLANVGMDIDSIKTEEEDKKITPAILARITTSYAEHIKKLALEPLNPVLQDMHTFHGKLVDAVKENPQLVAKLDPPSQVQLPFIFDGFMHTIESVVLYMSMLFDGYLSLVYHHGQHLPVLLDSMKRHRTKVLINIETEFMFNTVERKLWLQQVCFFCAYFTNMKAADIPLIQFLSPNIKDTFHTCLENYEFVHNKHEALYKTSKELYSRILDGRVQADLMHSRAQESRGRASLAPLPSPVSYPKSEPKLVSVGVVESDKGQERRKKGKKTKTRRAQSEPEQTGSSNNSDRGSSSEFCGDGDADSSDTDDDDSNPEVVMQSTLSALRMYYQRLNPCWDADKVRVAAQKEFWAEQAREEERTRQIEAMRLRVSNLNNADELPSFHTFPPSTPHPRSFAASIASSSTAADTSIKRHARQKKKAMPLEQFWQWHKEEEKRSRRKIKKKNQA